MGTRSKTRKKRATRSTRKKDSKKGGALWTPNKQDTVKRREALIAFAANSKNKSNAARQAVHQYLTHAEQEEKQEITLTGDDVILAITPLRDNMSLFDYVQFAKQRCEDLVITTIHQLMRQKKRINEERRLSKKTTFLANRAAARAQQAAHIASLGRLVNSSIDSGAQHELKAWNQSLFQRGLNQQHNLVEAERIFKNKTTIQNEEIRLRYELTKQLVQHIEKLDYILVLYYEIQSKSLGLLSVYYKTKEANTESIIPRAKAEIVKHIPALKDMGDRALPSVLEHVMELLVEASDAYMKTIRGTPLEMAKARLEHTRIQEKQLRYAKLHFEILVRGDYRLRQQLAQNPYLDAPKYQAILKQLEKDTQEVKTLEKK